MPDTSQAVARRRRPRLQAPALEALEVGDELSLERQVYRSIRQTLMSGAVAPGDKLSSRSVGIALGVSSMPVREALKRLEAEGVVESRAKSAFVVKGLTRAEYRQVLEVRLSLEGLAVRAAARHISSTQLTAVRRLARMVPMSRSGVEVLKHNFRFHFYVYQAAAMPYLLGVIESIWLRMGPALNQAYAELPVAAEYEPHDAMIAALSAHDPQAAEAALRRDLLDASERVAPLLEG
jgi:GntR family colanic acid and biofilm gene transcriptional regulator